MSDDDGSGAAARAHAYDVWHMKRCMQMEWCASGTENEALFQVDRLATHNLVVGWSERLKHERCWHGDRCGCGIELEQGTIVGARDDECAA